LSLVAQVKIGDFGLCHIFPFAGVPLFVEGLAMGGCLSYRAPEMVVGCPHSYPLDVWAIGSVLYFLLTAEASTPSPIHALLYLPHGSSGWGVVWFLQRLFEEESFEAEECDTAWSLVESGVPMTAFQAQRLFNPRVDAVWSPVLRGGMTLASPSPSFCW